MAGGSKIRKLAITPAAGEHYAFEFVEAFYKRRYQRGFRKETGFTSRQPTDPRHLVGTTVGRPALTVGDILAVQVYYDNEVVQTGGRTVPISEHGSLPFTSPGLRRFALARK